VGAIHPRRDAFPPAERRRRDIGHGEARVAVEDAQERVPAGHGLVGPLLGGLSAGQAHFRPDHNGDQRTALGRRHVNKIKGVWFLSSIGKFYCEFEL